MNTSLKQDLFEMIRPIPLSWLTPEDSTSVFETPAQDFREIVYWGNGVWIDTEDLPIGYSHDGYSELVPADWDIADIDQHVHTRLGDIF
jgi:hypothetical protein